MDLDSYNFSFSPIDRRDPGISSRDQHIFSAGRRRSGRPGELDDEKRGVRLARRIMGVQPQRRFRIPCAVPTIFADRQAAAPSIRNQFGGNIGGPVFIPKVYKRKDKTFFFFNWESGRQISGSFGGTAFVPPVAYRTGDFSAAGVTIFDPATGQPFPGNMIPQNRIQSYASKFLSGFVPAPECGIRVDH